MRISQSVEKQGVEVDEAIHNDLLTIVSENTQDVTINCPTGSFKQIFWEQQQKAATVKNACSMKWHPLMIKWCLYLRHLSGR